MTLFKSHKYAFVILLLVSCSTDKAVTNRFELYGSDTVSALEFDFEEEYQVDDIEWDYPYRERHWVFPDSSVIYATTSEYGSMWIAEWKTEEYGENILSKMSIGDSMVITGKRNGLHWKEVKCNDPDIPIIGYFNVQAEKIKYYDSLLESASLVK